MVHSYYGFFTNTSEGSSVPQMIRIGVMVVFINKAECPITKIPTCEKKDRVDPAKLGVAEDE